MVKNSKSTKNRLSPMSRKLRNEASQIPFKLLLCKTPILTSDFLQSRRKPLEDPMMSVANVPIQVTGGFKFQIRHTAVAVNTVAGINVVQVRLTSTQIASQMFPTLHGNTTLILAIIKLLSDIQVNNPTY